MQTIQELRKTLRRIDGRGYKAYKDLHGQYDCGDFTLFVDNVQSDPFAPPSRLRLRLPHEAAGFPGELFDNRTRKVALEDWLTRAFGRAARRVQSAGGDAGKGGSIEIDSCGQEILERTAVDMGEGSLEVRFTVGLPAKGRTILGRQAELILLDQLPQVVRQSLYYASHSSDDIRRHVDVCEDQAVLRNRLAGQGLTAFVANGSILPRESGISDRPLPSQRAVPFVSPPELEVGFELPHQGAVRGMGIPSGVTLVIGGGYHGKSTLLRALERSVYNHIPGDGRELIVTEASAVKIRAEDGRSVAGVDIDPFISGLPNQEDTRSFSSDNASGSTSQAANIMEALEAGAGALLLDEDTSATNFMIRDGRMQYLVAKEHEPITPFIDRVGELSEGLGVSTIIVLGGSGDYFDVADTVIMLKNYQAFEVTGQAREVAGRLTAHRQTEVADPLRNPSLRTPRPGSFQRGPKDKIKAKGLSEIGFGRERIDVHQLEQLVDGSQTRAIAEIVRLLCQRVDGGSPLVDLVASVLDEIDRQGLKALSPYPGKPPGNLALPRKQEIAAALNRYRKLRVAKAGG
jgi:predicted ABC-class ATPase